MTILLPVLFVAPILDWIAALLLVRAVRRFPGIRALRERTYVAVGIALATTIYFFVALNAEIGFSYFDMETTQTLARLAVSSIGLFPLYWLWLYFKGGFNGNDALRDDENDRQRLVREEDEHQVDIADHAKRHTVLKERSDVD